MNRSKKRTVENAILASMIADAEKDLLKLRALLTDIETKIEERTILLRALRKQRGRTVSSAIIEESQTEIPMAANGSGTWASRVDAILVGNKGKKIPTSEIVRMLGGKENRFDGIASPADVLVRSTLRAYRDKYGWESEIRERKSYWWK